VTDPVREFAEWLRQLRTSVGAPPYQEIVRRVREHDPTSSLAQSTVSETFNAKRLPRYETAIAIARALGGPAQASECHKRWTEARTQLDAGAPDPAPVTPAGRVRGKVLIAAGAAALLLAAIGVVVWQAQSGGTAAAGSTASAGASGNIQNAGPVNAGPTGVVAIQATWSPEAPCPNLYLPADAAGRALANPPATIDRHAARDPSAAGVVQITAQASADGVLITGIKTVKLHRAPAPTSGIFLAAGECGDNQAVRTFWVDLDKEPPTITGRDSQDSLTTIRATRFPFKVSRADPEVFEMVPFVRSCACTVSYEVDWVANGQQGKTIVDNDGHGFGYVPDSARLRQYYEYFDNGKPVRIEDQGMHHASS
jgi:hypothetical protein